MPGLLLGAAVLGIIIAVMEEGEFPGWWSMIACLLATTVPAAIINALLPGRLFLVGAIAGAITGACAISALCGMSVKRAAVAAGIYLAISIGMSLLLQVAF